MELLLHAEYKTVADSGSDVGIRTCSGGLYGITGSFKGASSYIENHLKI